MTSEEWAEKVVEVGELSPPDGWALLINGHVLKSYNHPVDTKNEAELLRQLLLKSLEPLLNSPPTLHGRDMTAERLNAIRDWTLDKGPFPEGGVEGEWTKEVMLEMLSYIDLLHSLLKDSEAYQQGLADGKAEEREAFREILTTPINTFGIRIPADWWKGDLLKWLEERR